MFNIQDEFLSKIMKSRMTIAIVFSMKGTMQNVLNDLPHTPVEDKYTTSTTHRGIDRWCA